MHSWFAWFTPPRVFWLLVLGASLGFLSYGVVASRPTRDDGYLDALIAAHTHRLRALEHDRDSLRTVALAAQRAYATQRDSTLALIARLPKATVVGDAVTLPQGTFVVAHPVAQYIVALQQIVRKVDTVFVAADTAISKTDQHAEKSDSVSVAADSVTKLTTQKADGNKPGLLARAWNAVKVPVAFVSGVAITVLVRR
jgi:hypothetical protein